MSEIERLRDLLGEQGIRFIDSRDGGVTFWLGVTECFASPTDDGNLYGGVGFLPWDCGHMEDAEHLLSWCRWRLGLEDE